jgi:hypothetical protein
MKQTVFFFALVINFMYSKSHSVRMLKRASEPGPWIAGSSTTFGHAVYDPAGNPTTTKGTCFPRGRVPEEIFNKYTQPSTLYYAAPDDIHEDIFGDPVCSQNDPNSPPQCDSQVSCNSCWEVKCTAKFEEHPDKDHDLSDTSVCKEGSVAVVVIDSCPVNHPINKNKNYNPCGQKEFPNLDIGPDAFEKISSFDVGHIHTKFRRIPCDMMDSINNGEGFIAPSQTDNDQSKVSQTEPSPSRPDGDEQLVVAVPSVQPDLRSEDSPEVVSSSIAALKPTLVTHYTSTSPPASVPKAKCIVNPNYRKSIQ